MFPIENRLIKVDSLKNKEYNQKERKSGQKSQAIAPICPDTPPHLTKMKDYAGKCKPMKWQTLSLFCYNLHG